MPRIFDHIEKPLLPALKESLSGIVTPYIAANSPLAELLIENGAM
jgi:hypothetical protein